MSAPGPPQCPCPRDNSKCLIMPPLIFPMIRTRRPRGAVISDQVNNWKIAPGVALAAAPARNGHPEFRPLFPCPTHPPTAAARQRGKPLARFGTASAKPKAPENPMPPNSPCPWPGAGPVRWRCRFIHPTLTHRPWRNIEKIWTASRFTAISPRCRRNRWPCWRTNATCPRRAGAGVRPASGTK